MIVDCLENFRDYQFLTPQILAGFQFLRHFDAATPDGLVEIQGADVYALVQTFVNESPERRRFEAHRYHIDIQCVIQSSERIFVEPVSRLTEATEYNAVDDITFYHDPAVSSGIVLKPGDFALFFPQDAHKPCCLAGDCAPVRKVVIKVRLHTAPMPHARATSA